MADDVIANPGAGGATFAADDIGGVFYPRTKIAWGVDGAAVDASATNPLPVTGSVATGGLTDAQLRAVAVPVSLATLPTLVAGTANIGDVDVLTVPADPFGVNADAASATGSISAKLRFIAGTGIPITGTVATTGPLTDTQLRATPVPVSGTVTTTPPSNASTNVAQVAGTTADTNSGVKSAGTLRVVLATDQPALTNKLLVTPDSVALPANQSVNVSQVAGTTADTNSGVKSAGTLRVVLATDQPALTNKLLVTPDSVALPANQSVNVAQLAGTTTDTNSGNKSAGTLRVTLATDQVQLTNALKVDGSAVTQPVSGTVTATPTGTYTTKETRSATGTTSQVADNAASVTILASNANRLGASIANDSTVTLYLKMGTTASVTDYSVPLVAGAYFEVPFGYTGRIDGIWISDPNTGSARVTEFT